MPVTLPKLSTTSPEAFFFARFRYLSDFATELPGARRAYETALGVPQPRLEFRVVVAVCMQTPFSFLCMYAVVAFFFLAFARFHDFLTAPAPTTPGSSLLVSPAVKRF